MAMARPRSRVFERPSSKQRAITPSSKEMTPAQKEKEKELMARVGNECFEAVKGCCGTHIYAHQKATAINLLLHHDWLCELRHAMRPRRTHLGFTADAFAHMRQRDSLLDSPPKNPPPVEEAWRPGTAPRFLAEGIVWPQHVRPATAVAEGEPPDDWPQFCKAFCITIKEGTRAQHLRLLFETYAREQPGAISREEARDVCLKHVHRSGRVEERPAKNAVCAQELVEDFDSVSREGFLDCVGFEELWRRHMRVYKQLKIDVWCLLQDLGRRDAAERAVMRRPFEQKRRDAWSLIDRKMATDVANFKDTL